MGQGEDGDAIVPARACAGAWGAVGSINPAPIPMIVSLVRALMLLCCAALTLAAAAERAPRPNILVIVSDDQGYADTGFQGAKDIPTPHIDSLAKNGVRCTNGYVSAPYCGPSRAGFFTGRYQTRLGAEFNARVGDERTLGLLDLRPQALHPVHPVSQGARTHARSLGRILPRCPITQALQDYLYPLLRILTGHHSPPRARVPVPYAGLAQPTAPSYRPVRSP